MASSECKQRQEGSVLWFVVCAHDKQPTDQKIDESNKQPTDQTTE